MNDGSSLAGVTRSLLATLGGREAREALAEKRPQRLEGAAARGAQDGFQCGEALLDRIEVRRTTRTAIGRIMVRRAGGVWK
jgi:hypothetical protein